MAKPALAGQKILKRLTIRDFVGDRGGLLAIAQTGKEKPSDKLGDAVPILRVIGQVTSYRVGQSRDGGGTWVECLGNFHATNLQTGEVQKSVAKMILPNVVSEPLAAALQGGATSAEFAVEIDVVYDETSVTFYTFEARTLLEVQPSDAIRGIFSQLAEKGITMTAPLKLKAPTLSEADQKKQDDAIAKRDKEKAEEKAGKAPAKV